jgi:hypothetical protein
LGGIPSGIVLRKTPSLSFGYEIRSSGVAEECFGVGKIFGMNLENRGSTCDQ